MLCSSCGCGGAFFSFAKPLVLAAPRAQSKQSTHVARQGEPRTPATRQNEAEAKHEVAATKATDCAQISPLLTTPKLPLHRLRCTQQIFLVRIQQRQTQRQLRFTCHGASSPKAAAKDGHGQPNACSRTQSGTLTLDFDMPAHPTPHPRKRLDRLMLLIPVTQRFRRGHPPPTPPPPTRGRTEDNQRTSPRSLTAP